jgi:hypothetical protein
MTRRSNGGETVFRSRGPSMDVYVQGTAGELTQVLLMGLQAMPDPGQ